MTPAGMLTTETEGKPTADRRRSTPVRVKLRRVNAHLSKPYPPDAADKVWWERLKIALGTTSSAFVKAHR
jgi:hypothetical protein